jgi:hypothetical protein
MRPIHWLFAVSVVLFVSGLGFVIAAERTRRLAPPAPATEARAAEPVATVRQLMAGVVDPAAKVIWDAVGTTVTADVEERRPTTDAEWARVETSAAVLIESANLLLDGPRAVDNGEWLTQARAMAASGRKALDAARAKNAQGIFDVGEEIYASCSGCHERYSRN